MQGPAAGRELASPRAHGHQVPALCIPDVGAWRRSLAASSHPGGDEPASATQPGPAVWQLLVPAELTQPVLPAPHGVGREGSTATRRAGSGAMGFAGQRPVPEVWQGCGSCWPCQALPSSAPGSGGCAHPASVTQAPSLYKVCTEGWLRAQFLFLVLPSAAPPTGMGGTQRWFRWGVVAPCPWYRCDQGVLGHQDGVGSSSRCCWALVW